MMFRHLKIQTKRMRMIANGKTALTVIVLFSARLHEDRRLVTPVARTGTWKVHFSNPHAGSRVADAGVRAMGMRVSC
jgi:hypothetical protein